MDLGNFERIFRHPVRFGPHTLDSPVRYEVWRDFALIEGALDLLLEPVSTTDRKQIASVLLEAYASLGLEDAPFPAVADDVVLVTLTFPAFLQVILPLTNWADLISEIAGLSKAEIMFHMRGAIRGEPPTSVPSYEDSQSRSVDALERLRWFLLLTARIGVQSTTSLDDDESKLSDLSDWISATFAKIYQSSLFPIETISRNRSAQTTIVRSRGTIKADAACRLFDINASDIGWAVVDTGIEARHPAFRRRNPETEGPYDEPFEEVGQDWVNRTRIQRTYDFVGAPEWLRVESPEQAIQLDVGTQIEQHGRVYYRPAVYRGPHDIHGTHVAGVIGADWSGVDEPLMGVCPQITLYDFRVLGRDGRGDEFSVLAALNHIHRINQEADRKRIAGVNLSLSLPHDVANYACGWTPICEACERLVDSGVVVVVSAGNTGYRGGPGLRLADGTTYLPISITDPGNAEKVITVGSTHREFPYRYGVSYFSARGPTADGRPKPDLIAPGEGIVGPIGIRDRIALDGTSQAAAHISGAIALLLARNRELIGRPAQIKEILCNAASDLGRDRAFQGHGLVDVLRALQSI